MRRIILMKQILAWLILVLFGIGSMKCFSDWNHKVALRDKGIGITAGGTPYWLPDEELPEHLLLIEFLKAVGRMD